jgi:hypothetical protein
MQFVPFPVRTRSRQIIENGLDPRAVAGVEKLAGDSGGGFGPVLRTDGDNSLKWDFADQ